MLTENWNKPHGRGNIDPENFSPYPKNPMIARFFKEIGRADELGSGVRNTYKYCGLYSPGIRPIFIEGDLFKAVIPAGIEGTTGQATGQVTGQVTGEVSGEVKKLIQVLSYEMKLKEIMKALEFSHRESFINNHLKPAMKTEFIEMKFPDSPRHPDQKYRLTQKGKRVKEQLKTLQDKHTKS